MKINGLKGSIPRVIWDLEDKLVMTQWQRSVQNNYNIQLRLVEFDWIQNLTIRKSSTTENPDGQWRLLVFRRFPKQWTKQNYRSTKCHLLSTGGKVSSFEIWTRDLAVIGWCTVGTIYGIMSLGLQVKHFVYRLAQYTIRGRISPVTCAHEQLSDITFTSLLWFYTLFYTSATIITGIKPMKVWYFNITLP